MLGLGAVDGGGGERWAVGCGCEGGSWRTCLEVEKGRIVDDASGLIA